MPTYNRANYLRVSLWNLLPQIKETNGLAELIIADNASIDNTKQVIDEACKWGEFSYICNDKNIGWIRSVYKILKEGAKGQFVWILGDDDLPHNNALKRIMEVLQINPHPEFVYVNFCFSANSNIDLQKIISEGRVINSADFNFNPSPNKDMRNRHVSKLREVAALDHICSTATFSSVWKKTDAISAFEIGIQADKEDFLSVAAVFPHTSFIAHNLLDKPAWYIGEPCIFVYNNYNSSFIKYIPFICLELFPSIYDLFEKKGIPSSVMNAHRAENLRAINYYCGFSRIKVKFSGIEKFSFLRFVKRHYRLREFWRQWFYFIRYIARSKFGRNAGIKSAKRISVLLS